MEAYAVVETGGKQYLVKPKMTLRVERLEAEAGAKLTLTPVLAVSDGTTLKVGTPNVDSASVSATVVEHVRGPKVKAFKKRRRKTYSRRKGHRQELTVITIDSVN